ncbi:hypothetical protein Tco_0087918 [Tanacetum coccineum]
MPAAVSPTAQSPDYVLESDPEADPVEDDDGGTEEDDDEVDIEADDDEEEEEHPASADSAVVALPAADQAPSAEETELFEIDESAATPPPHPAYRVQLGDFYSAPVLHSNGLMQRLPVLLAILLHHHPPVSPMVITTSLNTFPSTYPRYHRHHYQVAPVILDTELGRTYDNILSIRVRQDMACTCTAMLDSMETGGLDVPESWDDPLDENVTFLVQVDISTGLAEQLTEALKLIKRLQTQMAEFERTAGTAKGSPHHAQPEELRRRWLAELP